MYPLEGVVDHIGELFINTGRAVDVINRLWRVRVIPIRIGRAITGRYGRIGRTGRIERIGNARAGGRFGRRCGRHGLIGGE